MAKTEELEDTSRATNDAYTGMLGISLIALVMGCVLLYLDWSQYPEKDPPKVKAPAPNLAAPAPGPGAEQGAQPAIPMPVPPPANKGGMP